MAEKLKIKVDVNGKVIEAKWKGKDMEDKDYDPSEKKRIVGQGRLASQNWCTWRCVGGVWMCR